MNPLKMRNSRNTKFLTRKFNNKSLKKTTNKKLSFRKSKENYSNKY